VTATVRGLLVGVGRVALWLLVAMLLIRGAADVAAGRGNTSIVSGPARSVAPWPDDAARAFAVRFAWAYLGHSPRELGASPWEAGHRLVSSHRGLLERRWSAWT